eukprot:CAMPEP_0205903614 /NCGR_PEP_ID=MMETSP1325-20131115/214_1 /ASSEMBLY_ACC=CAM_ASM_000708 /TAXON_ID=236786 /ORGANISM="Florenciella sp., Strain RCC1007" /LENGTH=121 /DNA_ID=CAMNT_0053269287 /DNA_START=44 /DNA_END=410 /DNA_ORIENTATION=-
MSEAAPVRRREPPDIREVSRMFAGLTSVQALVADNEAWDERERFYRDFYTALYLENCMSDLRWNQLNHEGPSKEEARRLMLAALTGAYCSGDGSDSDYMCSACAVHCASRGWVGSEDSSGD